MVSDVEKIVIIGYGGHAKSVVDSIREIGKYEIVGYTDVEDKGIAEIVYLGTDDILKEVYDSGVYNAALGLGYMGKSLVRNELYEKLTEIGFKFPAIIAPSAVVSDSTNVGEGAFVGKRAIVNAESVIGKICIINSGAIIEHDNRIGNNTHIAVGAVLCGNVIIGSNCLIGANSTILQGLYVASESTVGAGSVVIENVGQSETVVGNPAKAIRR